MDLRHEAEEYIHNHFLSVVEMEEYSELPKEVLVRLLRSEHLQIESEFQVFNAAVNWLLHDPVARRRLVFEVLDCIRIPLLSPKKLEKSIEQCPDLSLKIALRKLVQDFHPEHGLQNPIYKVKSSSCKPRKCASRNIFVIGGYKRDSGGRWSDICYLNTVQVFNCFKESWQVVAPLRQARHGHGVAVLGGLIYVVGGESESIIFDSMECYDVGSNKWSHTACMTGPRCGLGVSACNGKIYALSGWVGASYGNTVETYDPQLGMWTRVGPVQTHRFAMGVVEHEGKVCLTGLFQILLSFLQAGTDQYYIFSSG